ncbi:hypothetical protein TNCV_765911 [Trichonephila clavipes]|nr:hypothetical protein TNCV_765911 [Trichonephila clavipes]
MPTSSKFRQTKFQSSDKSAGAGIRTRDLRKFSPTLCQLGYRDCSLCVRLRQRPAVILFKGLYSGTSDGSFVLPQEIDLNPQMYPYVSRGCRENPKSITSAYHSFCHLCTNYKTNRFTKQELADMHLAYGTSAESVHRARPQCKFKKTDILTIIMEIDDFDMELTDWTSLEL